LKFNNFGLDSRLLEGIDAIGYDNATPIQEQAIPIILNSKDLIASAQTGTGKTAAFLLPVIHKILNAPASNNIKALIIVPTRELAVQIDQNLEGLSYFAPVSSIAVYGGGDGSSFERERRALSEGADIVICTPGRMISHLNMGYVKVGNLKHLILDEADRMLDMGFVDDISKIISFLPSDRQTLLFSATMPGKIKELARKILHHPEEIRMAVSAPPERIIQMAYVVYEPQKLPLVNFVLKDKKLKSVLIFCSTKSSTKQLGRELKRAGYKAEDIHSDLLQSAREKALLDFKSGKLNILVATDILSRGIDIEDIELVINFDVPNDGEDYIHRIGRTARAETDGVAITFITEKEQRKFLVIEELLGKPVTKAVLPEQFGEAPTYDPQKKHFAPKGNFSRGKKPGGFKNNKFKKKLS
jgi:superfamily II DNA/RNA helicase